MFSEDRTVIKTTVAQGRSPGGDRFKVKFAAKILEAGPIAQGDRGTEAAPDPVISPGFIDIQVNGFCGVDFNHPHFQPEDLAGVCESLLKTGVTRFCPTLITAGTDRLAESIEKIRNACEKNDRVRSMVMGIHLEGPYINALDGPRGAHPKSAVSDPDWDEFYHLYQLSAGLVRLVTLAPELPGGLAFIRKAAQMGLVVGLGHCAPDAETIEAAVAAGARVSTHLGNGAHHMLPRHANYIQKQMADDALMASIICDGNHLPDYFTQNLVRAKGESRIILITDATAASAAAAGRYTLGDLAVEADASGALRLRGTPYLAGSTLTMDRAISNCRQATGIPLQSAIDMATINPARLLGDAGGELKAGRRADLVMFRVENDQLRIAKVYLAGRLVYSA